MTQQEDKIVSSLLSNLDTIKPERSNFDDVNQDIVDYVLPNRGDFQTKRSPGERRFRRIFDTTAITSLNALASIIHSGLTDPTSMWFNLVPKNKELADNEDVKRWISEVQEILFDVFSSSDSGFSQQNHQILIDVLGFGTSVLFVGDDTKSGITFQSRHLAEVYIVENDKGFVDTVYREFEYTARQAEQKWGSDSLSPKLKEALATDPHKKFKFVHAVMPKEDYERMAGKVESILDVFNFISVYISCEDKTVVNKKGYYELPYLIPRWDRMVGETYGRSPTWNALSDIKMLNVMSETVIKAAQKQVDPPLIMSDDGVLMPLQTFPGGVNIGGVNEEGKDLIKQLPTASRLDIGLEMMEQRRDAIRSAFFIDQFTGQGRQGRDRVTAVEIQDDRETRLRMMGPQIRRLEDEYLNPLITRVFNILKRRGKLPKLPDAVFESQKAELDFDIEYVSPLAFTQKSNKLLAYNRFFANAGTFIEFMPEVMDNFDVDKVIRDSAEAAGIPIDQMKSTDQRDKERQDRNEELARQQQIAEVQAGAETAATLQKSGIPVV